MAAQQALGAPDATSSRSVGAFGLLGKGPASHLGCKALVHRGCQGAHPEPARVAARHGGQLIRLHAAMQDANPRLGTAAAQAPLGQEGLSRSLWGGTSIAEAGMHSIWRS